MLLLLDRSLDTQGAHGAYIALSVTVDSDNYHGKSRFMVVKLIGMKITVWRPTRTWLFSRDEIAGDMRDVKTRREYAPIPHLEFGLFHWNSYIA